MGRHFGEPERRVCLPPWLHAPERFAVVSGALVGEMEGRQVRVRAAVGLIGPLLSRRHLRTHSALWEEKDTGKNALCLIIEK